MTPKFLICDAMEDDVEYVYHSHKPRFLAKRVYDHPKLDFEIIDEIDNISVFYKDNANGIVELLDELGEWYDHYLDWEEEQEESNL
jgi:hypothetical protein